MYIKHIELKNFRNYEHLDLSFDKNINFIVILKIYTFYKKSVLEGG